MTSDDRLTDLEILAAEQERTIGDLSAEIARQWQTVERLEKTVEALARRLLELEEQNAPAAPATKPPHW